MAGFAIPIAAVALTSIWLLAVVVVASALIVLATDGNTAALAKRRGSDSICTFARSFDRRSVDTWVIRAVYEELSDHTGIPPRREDRLEADLGIDPEDLDDLVAVIAARTGRPLTGCERNPWYGRVESVRDVVSFFVCQPPLRGA